MNTKLMIALYRYRCAVSRGEDRATALVQAIESVSETFYEYADLYKLAIALI